jgi:UDP-N-acetyl-D-mannosaminuronic acid dehydrogenase
MKKSVCIVGTGYVGLTLGAVLADNDFNVHCVEINKSIVKSLNSGEPHFHENGLKALMRKNLGKSLFFSTHFPEKPCEIYVICVSTPVDKNGKPILDYIVSASEAVAKNMADYALVVMRSTIPVGTSRNIVKPILDKSGKNYLLSFCPERTVEGNAIKELMELPQIIGGLDEASVRESVNFFKKIAPTTIEVSSLEAAEMIKLLNNSYRDMVFAYANEVALLCEKLSIDANEVIKAANLGYSRSSIPVPGFVGGACLEKDPYILSNVAESVGCKPKLIMAARAINEFLPIHVAKRIDNMLDSIGKNKNAKIFVLGFGFKGKPETDDVRGSPTITLVSTLKNLGYSNIFGFDPVVKPEVIKSLNAFPANVEEGFKGADCVIFANNHNSFNSLDIEFLIGMMNKPAVFFDSWQIFPPKIIIRNNIIYGGIGFE